MRPRRPVEIDQEYLKVQRNGQSYLVVTYQRMVSPSAIRNKTGGKRVVLDCGANMHVVSRKDLNSVDLEIVRATESPTTVVTANGEVLANDDATVYVKELDLFVTDDTDFGKGG